MKLKLLFTSLFTICCAAINAQITINENDIVGTYEMVFIATDTMSSGMTVGNGGTGQNWNYTFAQTNTEDTMMFTAPTAMPGATQFPNANLCYKLSGTDSTWWFFKKDATGLYMKGKSWVDAGQLRTMQYNTTMLTFPASMGSQYNFGGTFEAARFFLGIDPDGAGPHAMVDSIRIIRDIDESSAIDGLGTITTPLGQFGALRQVVSRIYIDTFMMKTNGSWDLFSPTMELLSGVNAVDTTEEYITRWWTNELGVRMPIMEMHTDAVGNVFKSKWVKAMSQTGIDEVNKGIVNIYPNPSNDIINISTVLSDIDHVVLINASGAQVMNAEIVNGSGLISIGHLDNGIYFLKLMNSSNEIVHAARIAVSK